MSSGLCKNCVHFLETYKQNYIFKSNTIKETVSVLWRPWARQLSRDIPVDVGFKCDKAALLGASIKEGFMWGYCWLQQFNMNFRESKWYCTISKEEEVLFKSDVRLTVHRNSVWKSNQLDVTLCYPLFLLYIEHIDPHR